MPRKSKAKHLAESSILRWQREGVDPIAVVDCVLAEATIRKQLKGTITAS